jgi:hypothetical protein
LGVILEKDLFGPKVSPNLMILKAIKYLYG